MTTALSSYTLAELKTATQQLIGDIEGTRYSDVQLADAINYAIKQLCLAKGYTYIQRPIMGMVSPGVQTVFPLAGANIDDIYDYKDYLKIVRVLTGGGWIVDWDAKSSYKAFEVPTDHTIAFMAPAGSTIVVDAVYSPSQTYPVTFSMENGTETSTNIWSQTWTHDPDAASPCIFSVEQLYGYPATDNYVEFTATISHGGSSCVLNMNSLIYYTPL